MPRHSLLLATLLACPLLALAQTSQQLATQAEAAYTARHFPESAHLYLEALRSTDEGNRGNLEYNAACSFALAHDPEQAFTYLDRSIADGQLDRDHISTDTDLVSLHPDPRWPKTLARIDSTLAAEQKRWNSPALTSPYTPNLSDAEKLAGLAHLWAEARYGFANFWHVPNLDWDAAYLAFIPQVTATTSTAQYYRVLQRFYALLEDGHTNVYLPEPIFPGRLPLRTRLVDDHVLILGSRDPANTSLDGIHIGDELLTINGQPVKTYAAQTIQPTISASSPQDRDHRTFDLFLLSGNVGDTLTLETQTPTGTRSTHHLTIPQWHAAHQPPFELRLLPNNIAYVALNSFEDDSAAKEFDQHWPEISHAHALILDLRENGGGDDSVGWHILSTLMDKPVPAPRSVSPRYIATWRAWGQLQTPLTFPTEMLPADPKRHFAGDVLLLTSPRTFSAAEDAAVVFAQSHRGRIIGEPTGGSTGQPLPFKLPGGGTARLCTKHDSFADGTEFIGVGVPPDVPVHPTAADIRSGRDTVLDRALTLLR